MGRKGRSATRRTRTPGSSRRLGKAAAAAADSPLSARADTKPEAKLSTPYKDVDSKLRDAHDGQKQQVDDSAIASLADRYEANANANVSEPKGVSSSRLHGASSVFDSLALADDIAAGAASEEE